MVLSVSEVLTKTSDPSGTSSFNLASASSPLATSTASTFRAVSASIAFPMDETSAVLVLLPSGIT